MTTQSATKVVNGVPGAEAAGFQRVRIVAASVDETVARLRQAIEAAGLWVLHEINPQMLLARGGYDIAASRQVLYFHPDRMARLLAADPSALLEAPLKFAVISLPNDQVTVRWIDPVAPFRRYGNPDLAQLGQELSVLAEAIATAALGPVR